jgi:DMSO reductase anchor subunit
VIHLELLVSLLILLLVIGVVYWIAAALLPHPIPLIVLVVGVIVLLFWLLGAVDNVNLNH